MSVIKMVKELNNSEVIEVMRMNKDTILIMIAAAVILTLALPKPVGTVLSLIILVPVVIYLIVDIVKNGNREKSKNFSFYKELHNDY